VLLRAIVVHDELQRLTIQHMYVVLTEEVYVLLIAEWTHSLLREPIGISKFRVDL